MKRVIFLIGLIVGMSAVLFAQQLTVAVSTFEARGGLAKDEADAITEIFISALVADGLVNVVDRSSFDMIISEMKFQASDWTDSERVLQLGKMLKATSIIRGTVMSLGGQVAITSNVLDLNTAQLISSSTLRMGSLDEVFDKMPTFVKDITKFLITAQKFEIGDTGPGGGIVFFIEGNVRKEVSLFLGTGSYRNVFALAKNYKGRGYTDWYLPGIRDLEHIYQNLQKTGKKNFAVGEGQNIYWSSTGDGEKHGYSDVEHNYYLNFSNGSRGRDYPYNDSYIYCALAVRNF